MRNAVPWSVTEVYVLPRVNVHAIFGDKRRLSTFHMWLRVSVRNAVGVLKRALLAQQNQCSSTSHK